MKTNVGELAEDPPGAERVGLLSRSSMPFAQNNSIRRGELALPSAPRVKGSGFVPARSGEGGEQRPK